ncbi:uncharacterized protein LOC113753389 isoform X1 [Coffea eugenioides]|uniref:uncharacterized protein LOC113753389 isoform X1 n=1 Tax=Coffea eugenioides TaxID=49369 RepID=UPI000F60A76D|nr:uncharacterized protein LOC113753389 isoform X1 [Coffea eugenioides]XP_027153327.1 uncharacterized protein LOC113753389 isoform X1 [Coffea eugenioides]XP_027153328.1 uncharacterized protein LOC113753389 isoform X1 [Coffea eugenioides]XP_027153329.1 uncharacterized protein LOC113753389 isoform X1 [Coffea eugenioides]
MPLKVDWWEKLINFMFYFASFCFGNFSCASVLPLVAPLYVENFEIPLEFVHERLKTKTFLVHIKSVQTQLADARQHYTVIKYSETNDIATSVQLAGKLMTAGEANGSSKVCLRLAGKFDDTDNVEGDDS